MFFAHCLTYLMLQNIGSVSQPVFSQCKSTTTNSYCLYLTYGNLPRFVHLIMSLNPSFFSDLLLLKASYKQQLSHHYFIYLIPWPMFHTDRFLIWQYLCSFTPNSLRYWGNKNCSKFVVVGYNVLLWRRVPTLC